MSHLERATAAGGHQTGHYVHRFGFLERIEHVILLLSFTLLALTGLPQMFSDSPISLFILSGLGGVQVVRSIHRAAASVLIVGAIFHLFYSIYKVFILRRPLSMMPGIQDARDMLHQIAYNVGIAKTRPAMDRYNFTEKIEYWAVVWGTVIMVITGYMLWNPIATTNVLPGEIIPAAKAAHGAEAVLAVLSIIIWHLYHVIRHRNLSIFSGRIPRHVMEEAHALELERIDTGTERPLPPKPTIWQRTRLYLPVTGVLAAVLLVGSYWFFTAEQTAITTVPPQQVGSPYSPRAREPLPTATPASDGLAAIPRALPLEARISVPEVSSHPVDEARSDCLLCHQVFSLIAPAPLDHAEYTNDGCMACHLPAAEVAP